jgi:hypothetical protein
MMNPIVLTNDGHNAGVLSEPGHRNRHFRIASHRHGEQYVDPDTWLTMNSPQEGSWWPAWSVWLAKKIWNAGLAASAGPNRWQIRAAGGGARPLRHDEINQAERQRSRPGVWCFDLAQCRGQESAWDIRS